MARPVVRDDVALMEGYHSPQLEVDIRLNTNEAPGSPPAEFADRVAEAVHGLEWHRYPSRSAGALRARIAEVESLVAGRALRSDEVFVANGSNEVLQTIMLAYGGAGRRALTFEPTYALHSHISKVCGTEVVSGGRDEAFAIEIETATRLISETRPAVTFLCSPNNPTGVIDPPEVIERVLDAVHAVVGLLGVDEAYGQFAEWSALSMVDDANSLVVSRTYSKTWSMAAARLGYGIGPSWLIEELDKVVLPYHLDAAKQAAGTIALDFEAEMAARVAMLVDERRRVTDGLARLDVDLWPSEANFVLFRPRAVDGATVWQRLVDRSILIRNCASWPNLEGCLRVTLGTPEENTAFLAALTEILEQP